RGLRQAEQERALRRGRGRVRALDHRPRHVTPTRPPQLWTTVTTRPIEARMLPTRTHSGSGPTFTTALPVLCTCQAISHPLSSLQAMAFCSAFTTCSKVWQSQLCRTVIHGGATSLSVTSSTSGAGRTRSLTPQILRVRRLGVEREPPG